MEKFAILSIPKKIDVEISKVGFHLVEEINQYLDENNASIKDYQVLTSSPGANVYRIFCRMEFHEPIHMRGVNYDDIIR